MNHTRSIAIETESNHSPVSPGRIEDIVGKLSAEDLRLLGLLARYFSSAIKIADQWVKPLCKREEIPFENGKLKEFFQLGLIQLLTPTSDSRDAIYHLTDSNLIERVLTAGITNHPHGRGQSEAAIPACKPTGRPRTSFKVK